MRPEWEMGVLCGANRRFIDWAKQNRPLQRLLLAVLCYHGSVALADDVVEKVVSQLNVSPCCPGRAEWQACSANTYPVEPLEAFQEREFAWHEAQVAQDAAVEGDGKRQRCDWCPRANACAAVPLFMQWHLPHAGGRAKCDTNARGFGACGYELSWHCGSTGTRAYRVAALREVSH